MTNGDQSMFNGSMCEYVDVFSQVDGEFVRKFGEVFLEVEGVFPVNVVYQVDEQRVHICNENRVTLTHTHMHTLSKSHSQALAHLISHCHSRFITDAIIT